MGGIAQDFRGSAFYLKDVVDPGLVVCIVVAAVVVTDVSEWGRGRRRRSVSRVLASLWRLGPSRRAAGGRGFLILLLGYNKVAISDLNRTASGLIITNDGLVYVINEEVEELVRVLLHEVVELNWKFERKDKKKVDILTSFCFGFFGVGEILFSNSSPLCSIPVPWKCRP